MGLWLCLADAVDFSSDQQCWVRNSSVSGQILAPLNINSLQFHKKTYMLAKKADNQESSPRRSSRKVKPISKAFSVYSWKSGSRRKPSVQALKPQIPAEVQTRCLGLMLGDQTKESERLLSQMQKAVEQQCTRLWQLSGIKLKLQHLNIYVQTPQPIKKLTVKQPLLPLDHLQEQVRLREQPRISFQWKLQEEMKPEQIGAGSQSESNSADVFEDLDAWSCPEEMQINPVPKLRRHESAKLLCDNYEKQELIYSVQTLIPRLHRQDMEHHFGTFH